MDAPALAGLIDHTLLDPLATASQVEQLCREAVEWGIGHVCVSPTRVHQAVAVLTGAPVGVCSVVGFPSGAHPAEVKVAEAGRAAAEGATEVDVVVALGAVADGDWATVEADVAAVVAAVGPDVATKVILETAALTPDQARHAAEAAIAAGAGWVKTSTGYHPSGGATVDAVRLLCEVAAGRARVKASGGIRSLADATAMVDAGAARLGTSRGVALLRELTGR